MTATKLDAKEMGRRLRELRGVFRSQDQVAEELGVSTASISLYENGHRIPSSAAAAKLARYYGVPTDYIFFGKN